MNWRRNLASILDLWRRFLEPVSGACVRGLSSGQVYWTLDNNVQTNEDESAMNNNISYHVSSLVSNSFTTDCSSDLTAPAAAGVGARDFVSVGLSVCLSVRLSHS